MAIKKKIDISIDFISDKLMTNNEMSSALKMSYKKTEIVSVEDAYIVVQEINGNKENLSFTIYIYSDESKEFLIEKRYMYFSPDVSSNSTLNYHTQIYNYLKTLPEFINAYDV